MALDIYTVNIPELLRKEQLTDEEYEVKSILINCFKQKIKPAQTFKILECWYKNKVEFEKQKEFNEKYKKLKDEGERNDAILIILICLFAFILPYVIFILLLWFGIINP